MNNWIVSPIITPPPSRERLVVIPKSFRSISAVAEKPARLLP
jgi:hypothetical protein